MQSQKSQGKPEGIWVYCDPLPPICVTHARQVVVGRDDSCDLVLPHKSVSRRHAVISFTEICGSIEDCDSCNGTIVNGKRIKKSKVLPNDIVLIGPYQLEFQARPRVIPTNRHLVTDTDYLTIMPESASISGQLSKIPLGEILQSIEFYEKTGTLIVQGEQAEGRFIFAAGRPITARFAGTTDRAALMQMLALREGNFVVSDSIEPTEATFKTTITSLLLDFSRLQDESSKSSEV